MVVGVLVDKTSAESIRRCLYRAKLLRRIRRVDASETVEALDGKELAMDDLSRWLLLELTPDASAELVAVGVDAFLAKNLRSDSAPGGSRVAGGERRVPSDNCKPDTNGTAVSVPTAVAVRILPSAVSDVLPGASAEVKSDNFRFSFVDLFAGVGGFAAALGPPRRRGSPACPDANAKEHLPCNSSNSSSSSSSSSSPASSAAAASLGLNGCCLLSSEKDGEARALYERNHGRPVRGFNCDIRELTELPACDILCGGFPCQSFSCATAAPEGLRCAKNGGLFFEITRLLKESPRAPRAVLLENVPNLLEIDDGAAFAVVKRELEACGYEVYWKVISSHEAGLPQHRPRLYIVGIHTNSVAAATPSSRLMPLQFRWPSFDGVTKFLSVRDVLERDPTVLSVHRLTRHQWLKVRQHRSYKTSVKKRRVDVDGLARTLGARYRVGYLIQSEFIPWDGEDDDDDDDGDYNAEEKTNKDGEDDIAGEAEDKYPVDPEATAAAKRPRASAAAHDARRPRFFTPREAARLQGFPEDFVLAGVRNHNRWYAQCGNAVSPPVVQEIAREILKSLQI